MNSGEKIAKNTSLFLISQIISYLIGLIYTIYLARYLGPANFGIITFALSFISVLGIFTDLGLNNLMTREIARDKTLTPKYLNNFISIKILMVFLVSLFAVIFLSLSHYPLITIYVLYIFIINLILVTFSGVFNALFQAFEELKYQSIAILLNSFFMLISVYLAIFYHFNIIVFAIIYLLSNGIWLIYNLIIAYRNFILPKLEKDWKFWKDNTKIALGFGLSAIFTVIYVWIDSIMLFFMQGDLAVGIYGAAYRIVLVLLFIPSAFTAAFFPAMSRFYISSHESLKKIVFKYFKYMLFLGIPIGFGGTVLAGDIINTVYGYSYLESGAVFQILIWATVFTFLNSAFVQLFQSTNEQLVVTKVTAIGLIINIILNLILIPKYTYIGASVSTLITEFIVAFLLIRAYKNSRYVADKKEVFYVFFKIIVISALSTIVIWIARDLNIFFLIIIFTIIYFLLSNIFKVADEDDINIIKNILWWNK